MSQEEPQPSLIVNGIDIRHTRLVELTRLADQARPFYDWVEKVFQNTIITESSLSDMLMSASREQIEFGIRTCYFPVSKVGVPILFDGIGRSYPHQRGCYYFFSWIVRDAPKQRLEPLLRRIVKASGKRRVEVELKALAALIVKYRSILHTFSWDATREIILDRLEGSCRSISGHERETVVRTALATAVQSYFIDHTNYGIYATVEMPIGQIRVSRETFDVSVLLKDSQGKVLRRILVPVKTRETEGGGHAHLFTRDIMSAIQAARANNPEDFVVAVIVARNWSVRESETVKAGVDHMMIFDLSPIEFQVFTEQEQQELTMLIGEILSGNILPKHGERGAAP